jgi:tetratricopeptide (TPR) repeat protein
MAPPDGFRRPALRVIAVVLFAALSIASAPAGAKAKPEERGADGERKGTGLSKPVADKLLAANELLAKDKYDDALEIVDGVSKRRSLKPPELAQIHRFRGYIFASKSMPEKAAEELKLALDQHAFDPSTEQLTTYSLAQIYTQIGRYDRALEVIDEWFQTAESPPADAYYLKAMILVQQEKFDAALEPAKKAIEMTPAPRESWIQLLAAIYIETRDYPNVAATLERLVGMSPNKKQYWVQLAAVQHHLERDAKAAATLRLADQAKLLNEDREFRQLARLLFLREQPYQCAKIIEDAMRSGAVKADADAYKLISNCYIAARETDQALEPLAKAAELAPDGEMYLLLGQLHLQRERFTPALDALQKALAKSKPERRGSAQLLIGVAQLGSEHYDAAERAFRAAEGDEKVRRAAESYLKYLDEQRARRVGQESLQTASSN